MMEELVSVIVPVYNVEPYLRECVDSILNNTYRNLEVILVDDGSPDRCGKICDEYEKLDSRVRVIHQQNGGLVGARNAGLDAATGNYISFVDSDDMVSPVFYEVMVRTMEDNKADMVGCEGCREIKFLASEVRLDFFSYIAETYENQLSLITTAPSVREKSWTGCYVWNKLYRKDKIQSKFLKDCLICEDLQFNSKYIQNCDKFITIAIPLYFYRPNPTSILANYHSILSKPELGIANAKIWEEISVEPVIDQELDAFLKARAVYTAHGALMRIFTHDHRDYMETSTHLRRLMKTDFKCFWNDKSSYSLSVRVAGLVCCYVFPVWRVLTYGCKYYSKWKMTK